MTDQIIDQLYQIANDFAELDGVYEDYQDNATIDWAEGGIEDCVDDTAYEDEIIDYAQKELGRKLNDEEKKQLLECGHEEFLNRQDNGNENVIEYYRDYGEE